MPVAAETSCQPRKEVAGADISNRSGKVNQGSLTRSQTWPRSKFENHGYNVAKTNCWTSNRTGETPKDLHLAGQEMSFPVSP